jgi:hypothetical protein
MKKMWVQAALATVALTFLQMVLSPFLVPASAARAGGAPGAGLALVLLSNAMIATLLTWIARRLAGGPLERALVLWAIWGGIQVNSMIETLLFDISLPKPDALWLTLFGVLCAAGVALLLGRTVPAATTEPPAPRAPVPAWWRFAVCDVAYIALYFIAGMAVWPYLRAFYEARPMPAMPAVAALQVFRGLVFTGIVLLIVRRMCVGRATAALASGLALSVLGGIAPLIVPNPYLPAAIRYAHLPEVGVSNVLFGLIAGWLLAPHVPEQNVARAVARASA